MTGPPAPAGPPGGPDLVVLVPMLGRAHRVAPVLDSLTGNPAGADVLFLLSPHDHAVRDAVERCRGQALLVPYNARGDYARKINRGIAETHTRYVFTAADDLRFHPGWFEAAHAYMSKNVAVVGTNDLANQRGGTHATHFLVARWYVEQHGTIDEPGKLMFDGYVHEFCDDGADRSSPSSSRWRRC